MANVLISCKESMFGLLIRNYALEITHPFLKKIIIIILKWPRGANLQILAPTIIWWEEEERRKRYLVVIQQHTTTIKQARKGFCTSNLNTPYTPKNKLRDFFKILLENWKWWYFCIREKRSLPRSLYRNCLSHSKHFLPHRANFEKVGNNSQGLFPMTTPSSPYGISLSALYRYEVRANNIRAQ